MENKNPECKSLADLLKEADEKKLNVLIVEGPVLDGNERLAALGQLDHVMIIHVCDLLEDDQKRVSSFFAKDISISELVKDLPHLPIPIKRLPPMEDLTAIRDLLHTEKGGAPHLHNKKPFFPQRSSKGFNNQKNFRRKH